MFTSEQQTSNRQDCAECSKTCTDIITMSLQHYPTNTADWLREVIHFRLVARRWVLMKLLHGLTHGKKSGSIKINLTPSQHPCEAHLTQSDSFAHPPHPIYIRTACKQTTLQSAPVICRHCLLGNRELLTVQEVALYVLSGQSRQDWKMVILDSRRDGRLKSNNRLCSNSMKLKLGTVANH